jgi:hypothetical protein
MHARPAEREVVVGDRDIVVGVEILHDLPPDTFAKIEPIYRAHAPGLNPYGRWPDVVGEALGSEVTVRTRVVALFAERSRVDS